jgi:hypothetical protein
VAAYSCEGAWIRISGFPGIFGAWKKITNEKTPKITAFCTFSLPQQLHPERKLHFSWINSAPNGGS